MENEHTARTQEQVTRLLSAIDRGEADAVDRLLPLIYDELKLLARAQLRGQTPGDTLNTTGLVHEAYMRLAGAESPGSRSRVQFFALAATAMRSVIVDHARKRNAEKRGGGRRRVPLDNAVDVIERQGVDVLALHEALTNLAQIDERKARVVELRYFVGMSVEETAHVLDISAPTAKREWRAAKAWLKQMLGGDLRSNGDRDES